MVVKIELWPGGDKARARPMGDILISNVGGNIDVGEYRVELSKFAGFANPLKPLARERWRVGKVKGFLRRKYGPFDLIGIALINILGDRLVKALAVDEDEAGPLGWGA